MVKKLLLLMLFVVMYNNHLLCAAHNTNIPLPKADDAPSCLSASEPTGPTLPIAIPKSIPISVTPQVKRHVSAGEQFMKQHSLKLSRRKKQSEQHNEPNDDE